MFNEMFVKYTACVCHIARFSTNNWNYLFGVEIILEVIQIYL